MPKVVAHTPGDGSCLYYSIALGYLLASLGDEAEFSERCFSLFGNKRNLVSELKTCLAQYDGQEEFIKSTSLIQEVVEKRLRISLVNYMRSRFNFYRELYNIHREEGSPERDPEGFRQYLEQQARPKEWGGPVEIHALSAMLNIEIIIHSKDSSPVSYRVSEVAQAPTVELSYCLYKSEDEALPTKSASSPANHYNILIEDRFLVSHIQASQAPSEVVHDQLSPAAFPKIKEDHSEITSLSALKQKIVEAEFNDDLIPTVDISQLTHVPYSILLQAYDELLSTTHYDATVFPFDLMQSKVDPASHHFNSVGLLQRYGGATCVGMALLLKQKLDNALSALGLNIKSSQIASTLPSNMKQKGFPEYCHVAVLMKCKEGLNEFLILFDPAFYFEKPVFIEKNKKTTMRGIGKRQWTFFWDGGGRIDTHVDEEPEGYYYRLQEILNPDQAITDPAAKQFQKLHVVSQLPEGAGLEHLVFDLSGSGTIRIKTNSSKSTPPGIEGFQMGSIMTPWMLLMNELASPELDLEQAELLILSIARAFGAELSSSKARALIMPLAILANWLPNLLAAQEGSLDSNTAQLTDCLFEISTILGMGASRDDVAELIQFAGETLSQFFINGIEKMETVSGLEGLDAYNNFMSALQPAAAETSNFISTELGLGGDKDYLESFFQSFPIASESPKIPKHDGFRYQAMVNGSLPEILAAITKQDPHSLSAQLEHFHDEHEEELLEILQEMSVNFPMLEAAGIDWLNNLNIYILMRILRRPICVSLPNESINYSHKLASFSAEPLILYYNGSSYCGHYLAIDGKSPRESLCALIEKYSNPLSSIFKSNEDPSISVQNFMAQHLSIGSAYMAAYMSKLYPKEEALMSREYLRDLLRWFRGDKNLPNLQITLFNRELRIPFPRYLKEPGILNQFLAPKTSFFHSCSFFRNRSPRSALEGLEHLAALGDKHYLFNAVAMALANETYRDPMHLLRDMVASALADKDRLKRLCAIYPALAILAISPGEYAAAMGSGRLGDSDLERNILMEVLQRPIFVINSDGKFIKENNKYFPGEPIFIRGDSSNRFGAYVLAKGLATRAREIATRLIQFNRVSIMDEKSDDPRNMHPRITAIIKSR